MLNEALQKKFEKLQEILREKKRVAVAYSGGVDSAFLLWAAATVLGENAVALTVEGDMTTGEDMESANAFAAQYGIAQYTLPVDIFRLRGFSENTPERCYYCKQFLFQKMKLFAATRQMTLVEGSNVDDLRDYRPGRKALEQLEIASPLIEAELNKEEIRQLSKAYGLSTWDKPSCACLASRVPYYTEITPEILLQIAQAETFLHALGIEQVRVRHHGDLARIETDEDGMEQIYQDNLMIAERLKTFGYRYVTMDLEEYRTGRLNEVLDM